MEDIEYDGSLVWQKTSDYALGARGIDAISVTTGTGTTVSNLSCVYVLSQ